MYEILKLYDARCLPLELFLFYLGELTNPSEKSKCNMTYKKKNIINSKVSLKIKTYIYSSCDQSKEKKCIEITKGRKRINKYKLKKQKTS